MGSWVWREVQEERDIYFFLWLIHIVVQQKSTHCKAIILQLKKNFFKGGECFCGTISSLLYRQYAKYTKSRFCTLINFFLCFSPLSDNFQDQMKRELAYREEMVQQLQIVRCIST